MSNLIFQAAALRQGKRGIIKPDAAGYYEQCIGGLNIHNHAGAKYVVTDKVKDLFSNSSDLQRRVRDRALKGELGHPRRGPEHDTNPKWIARLNDIVESNVSVYWTKIELDFSYGRNNPHLNMPDMVGIIGRFRPGGAHGDALVKDLADPESNVAFSIRSFSLPTFSAGRTFYELQSIVTWDQVNEPGLAPATKLLSATMEDRSTEQFTPRQVSEAVEMAAAAVARAKAGSCPVVSNESANNLLTLSNSLNASAYKSSIYCNW